MCDAVDTFSVKIPRVGVVRAATVAALGDAAWDAVHGNNASGESFGCSVVGSGWPVKQDGRAIGTLRYNGRFDATPVTSLPGYEKPRHWYDANTNGFTDADAS